MLWGAALAAAGAWLGDEGAPSAVVVAAAVRDAYNALTRLGGATRGDKTMLDAWEPFANELAERVGAGSPLAQAWRSAARVADESARATAEMRPKVGRARPLADRSVGTPDAGAHSFALVAAAVAGVLEQDTDHDQEEKS